MTDGNEKQTLPAVGCIGLGVMGRPAAMNILRAGYPLCVWARREEATKPLVAEGARAASSAKALAEVCEIIVINVSDTPDVEEVILGKNGVREGIAAGGLVIDMSTIAPSAASLIAAALSAGGVDFLDAPVSGGEAGAVAATLTFMVGGEAAAFERASPLLAAMGKTFTHVGGAGAGQVAKACNQIIIGAAMSGVAEAFRLAAANGVDLARVRQALLGGFAGGKVLEVHALRMISGDYAPGFRAALHDKDIGIALAEAESSGVPLPSAALFRRRLRQLIDGGRGDLDSSAIALAVEEEE